jgi:putative addiction module component (TIGR02574 family)
MVEEENDYVNTVRKEVLALSAKDRLHLIEELWDSLAATPEVVPVTDAQRRELARRRRTHARNPSAARPWEEVIIANRPYGNRRDLVRKGVPGEDKFEKVRDSVYVEHAKE